MFCLTITYFFSVCLIGLQHCVSVAQCLSDLLVTGRLMLLLLLLMLLIH